MIHDPACPDLITHARRALDERPAGNLEAHCIEAEREWEAEQATAPAVIADAEAVAFAYWAVVDGHPEYEDPITAAKWEADRWSAACE